MDPGWIPDGSRMDPGWIPDGPRRPQEAPRAQQNDEETQNKATAKAKQKQKQCKSYAKAKAKGKAKAKAEAQAKAKAKTKDVERVAGAQIEGRPLHNGHSWEGEGPGSPNWRNWSTSLTKLPFL